MHKCVCISVHAHVHMLLGMYERVCRWAHMCLWRDFSMQVT